MTELTIRHSSTLLWFKMNVIYKVTIQDPIFRHSCLVSSSGVIYLRNRKHFPCFYRVIETRVEVWENEKRCGNTSCRRVFPQLFRVLPNLHECFYNSIETRRKCFLFLLENSLRKITKTEENLIVLFIIKT